MTPSERLTQQLKESIALEDKGQTAVTPTNKMLSIDDKKFFVDLATIMMNHLAWMIAKGKPTKVPFPTDGAQVDWNDGTGQSFKEKTTDLLLSQRG